MSIQSEINRIKAAAAAIAASITNKGVTVPDGTKLDGMAALIGSIQTGSGGDAPTISDASYFFYEGVRTGDEFESMKKYVSRPSKMQSMFDSATIQNLDLSWLDTSAVANMNYAFHSLKGTPILDLSCLDTRNVTNMSYALSYCEAEQIILDGIDTSHVTDMSNMCYACKHITSIDFSGIDTSQVNDMSGIFSYCTALTEILGFSALAAEGLDIGFPKGGQYSGTFALRRLTFRTDLPDGQYSIRSNIDIRYCSFDRAGMVEMFGTLPDLNGSGVSTSNRKITITANPCVKNGSLTSADRSIATTKGWTLVE